MIKNAGRSIIGFSVILLCAVSILIAKSSSPPLAGNWVVTFEDEFEGSELDSDKWKIGQHWAGINGGAQPHQDNVAVVDGALRFMWDKKDSEFTFGERSSMRGTCEVSTYKRFHQKYGYFECRMKYDVQRGCWPAFWTMPVKKSFGGHDNIQQIYLKFDLSGKTAAGVNDAVLKLKVKSAPDGYFFDVYRVTDDSWTESAITWKNKPKFDAMFIDHVKPGVAAGGWVEIDVTDYVKAQLAGDKKVSFMLADMYQKAKKVVFHSSEAAAADRPHLVMSNEQIDATEDSYVHAANAETNYGDETELIYHESWGYDCGTYTPGMEIDIHETLGIWGPNKTSHAWHWDGYGKDHKSDHHRVTNTPDQNEYCTFGLHWTEGKMEFYVDGTKTHTHTGTEVCAVPSFMIISGQVGGWDNNGKDLAVNFEPHLPKYLYVDHVRVWAPEGSSAARCVQKSHAVSRDMFAACSGTVQISIYSLSGKRIAAKNVKVSEGEMIDTKSIAAIAHGARIIAVNGAGISRQYKVIH